MGPTLRTLTFALLVAACGGKGKAASTAPGHEHGDHHHEGSDEHGGMSLEMSRFHDLLQPRWHAAAGPERQKATCDVIAEFQAEADAVAKATPPQTTNADTWTAGTRALVAATADLAATCKSGSGFDDALGKVHEAFHSLMEQGEHGTGGGGTNGGGKDGESPGAEHAEHHDAGSAGPAHEPREHQHGD